MGQLVLLLRIQPRECERTNFVIILHSKPFVVHGSSYPLKNIPEASFRPRLVDLCHGSLDYIGGNVAHDLAIDLGSDNMPVGRDLDLCGMSEFPAPHPSLKIVHNLRHENGMMIG